MTENEAKTIDDCLKELRKHRSEYLKRSTPWRIINRAVRLIIELKEYKAIGTIEEFKALKENSVPIVTGEWIDTQPEHNNGYYKNAHVCSNCNNYYTTEYHEMKFCPNCGAKMTET